MTVELLIFNILWLNMASISWIFTLNSWQEGESRALKLGLFSSILATLGAAVLLNYSFAGLLNKFSWAWVVLDLILLTGILLMSAPWEKNKGAFRGCENYIEGSVKNFDERDTVFSRYRSLKAGSTQYKEYYSRHPELEEMDAERRKEFNDRGNTKKIIDDKNKTNRVFARSSERLSWYLGKEEVVVPQPSEEKTEISPLEMAEKIKGYARHLGADLVGITRLDPRWVYSHTGDIHYDNWDDWGKAITLEHDYAIVVATEVNRDMVVTSPHTPASVEMNSKYALGSFIAVQVANFLAGMGYSARAHHFRNYMVNCVPIAVEAGLGELGRNGYLITKEFGPRVRISIITTNALLKTDQPIDLGVQHFCEVCKKCARLCPSKSISLGEKTVDNGIRRWNVQPEGCHMFWAKIGTGCSICMGTCPWSHPNTLIHRISKWMAIRSPVARIVLTWLDDVVYGSYQKSKVPAWVDYSEK